MRNDSNETQPPAKSEPLPVPQDDDFELPPVGYCNNEGPCESCQ